MAGDTIKIGILHSLSGTMAGSETPVKDAEMLAIEEINAAGGLLNKRLEVVIEDGASDAPTFAAKARKLLERDQVSVVFGGWTSISRKMMLPVFEELNGLLFYPIQYEGMEMSPNIFYIGATTNQQIIPSVTWLLENKGRRFFIVGSDYIFPQTASTIIKKQLAAFDGELVQEEYTPLGHTEFQQIVKDIKAKRPDVIYNMLNGDSNLAFFKQLKEAGITPDDIPVLSVSVAEEEIRSIGPPLVAGHLTAWNYFQTVNTAENRAFVKKYKAAYGKDRVTSDPIEAGYVAVHLWAKMVEKAGTTETNALRSIAGEIDLAAPEGTVSVDRNTQHIYKKARVGEINRDGMIRELWRTEEAIAPDPYLKSYAWANSDQEAAAWGKKRKMSSAWLTLSFALIAVLLLSSLASIVGMNRMNSAHETSYSALTAGYQLQQSATRLEALSLGLPAGGGTVMNEVEELLEQIALVEKAASEQPALLQAIKDEAESVAALLGQATVNSESIRPAAAELSSAIDTLILELQGQTDSGKTIQSVTTIFLLLLFLLTALIAGYLAVTHDKRMSRSLEKLLRYMNNVSNGNLDANPLSVSDAAEVGELASAVNRMTAHLKEMIKQIAEASEKLTAESHRLSKEATSTMEAALDIDMIISSTAEQAKEQQTGAKETAITIKEIASGIHRNANLLSEVNHSSNASASLADSGHKIISRATEQVNEVNRATDDLNELVTTMRNRAGEISEIVAGINQISEQTNILALNAGIEASRAGEKGRGFSVIAKEIRNLAETSKTSAERIDDLIMLLRTNTEKVAEVLNKGVEETVASVNEAGEMFDSISSSIRSVSQQIEDASATFEEMSAGTDQVLLVTEHQVTHAEQASASFVQVAENAGRQRVTIKEIATSANTLYRIAEKLQQTVTSFRT